MFRLASPMISKLRITASCTISLSRNTDSVMFSVYFECDGLLEGYVSSSQVDVAFLCSYRYRFCQYSRAKLFGSCHRRQYVHRGIEQLFQFVVNGAEVK